MAFVRSDDIIAVLRNRLGLNEKTYAVMQIWEKELGSLAQYVELTAFKKGMLVVEVASSVHFNEMHLRRRELIQKINQHFGTEKVVKSIQLKLKK